MVFSGTTISSSGSNRLNCSPTEPNPILISRAATPRELAGADDDQLGAVP